MKWMGNVHSVGSERNYLPEKFRKYRDLHTSNMNVMSRVSNLVVVEYSDTTMSFVCDPWGAGVVTLILRYDSVTKSGMYFVRPEFSISERITKIHSDDLRCALLIREINGVTLDEFLKTMQDSINESECNISGINSNLEKTDFELTFRGHVLRRRYSTGDEEYVEFTCDVDSESSSAKHDITLIPDDDGRNCIVMFTLKDPIESIKAEMVHID